MIKDTKNVANKEKAMSLTGTSSFASKISRFVTAIYMISNCVPENEPIQLEIISESIVLLSTSKDIEYFEDRRLGGIQQIKRSLTYIKSLFDIVHSMQYISLMNYSVITNHIEFLYRLSDTLIVESQKRFEFENFFSYESYNDSIKDNKGQVKDSVSFKNTIDKQTVFSIKDTGVDKADRLNKIISFLKDHKKSSIKDIFVNVGQASEKTVQRDLTHLVLKGVVIREGERRWSTYSLNNNK